MRKTKLTEERRDSLVALIEGGSYANKAALASGISERTFYRWLTRGENAAKDCEQWEEAQGQWQELSPEEQALSPELLPDESTKPSDDDWLYYTFWRDVKRAESLAEAKAIKEVRSAAYDSWQAAAWFLERRFGWTRNDKVEVEGTVQHKLGLGASAEELEAARQRLEAARTKEIEPAVEVDAVEVSDQEDSAES